MLQLPVIIYSRFSSPRKYWLISILITVLLSTSCSSIRRANQNINNRLETSQVFKQGFTGIAIYDPEKEKMLFEYNADKYFIPASNTKLFTLYTGLKILGDSVPAIKYSVKQDSLIFKGTGDPSFLNRFFPDSEIIDFLKEREELFFYVPPQVREEALGPGWAWDDYNASYSAEKSDFPVYGNLIEVQFKKNEDSPKIIPSILEDSLLTVFPGKKPKSYARRNISSNSIKFEKFNREEDYTQYIPFKISPELTTRILSDTLKKQVEIYQGNPENIDFENTLYSIPSDSLYKRMMQFSDNFIAEQILLMAAGQLSDTLKTGIAIEHMKEEYLQDLPDEPIWVDGSGLSRYNLFTPRSLVKLLIKLKEESSVQKLFSIFPAGGKSGTLQNDYEAETPYIYAKTGTLRNNHSLSGFLITRKGKILIFSFMNSNYTVPTSNLKEEMASILKEIRDNY